jgi:hypothetical protein
MNRVNRDLEEVYDYYVREWVGEVERRYGVGGLWGIWEGIKRPARRKPRPHRAEDTHQTAREKMRGLLRMLKPEDLHRHCLRNGIQPPAQREDMIQAILARACPL